MKQDTQTYISDFKEVQQIKIKSTPKEKLYLIVIRLLQKGTMPIKICSELDITKQKLQYYLSRLKRGGYIKKVGYGTWEVDTQKYISDIKEVQQIKIKSTQVATNHLKGAYKEVQQIKLKSIKGLKEDSVRGHSFMFYLKLPCIDNWGNRHKFLDKKGIKYDILKHDGIKINYKGKKVHLWRKCIIIYDKESYIADMAKDTRSTAIYGFLGIIKSLETLFGVSLTINRNYQFKVAREHYALIKNCLARQYDKEGKKLQIYNYKGLWMLIDNSFNLHETETVMAKEAVLDNEGIQKYFNSHKATDFKVTPEFILNCFNQNNTSMDKLIGVQGVFADNLKSHIKAIKEIGKGSKQLASSVKELSNLIKNRV